MEVNVSSTEEKISPTSAIMGSEKLEFTDFYEGEFGLKTGTVMWPYYRYVQLHT